MILNYKCWKIYLFQGRQQWSENMTPLCPYMLFQFHPLEAILLKIHTYSVAFKHGAGVPLYHSMVSRNQ